MIQGLSFEELPDKLKIEILLKDNQSLRKKIEAEELENNSLYDEIHLLKKKYADLMAKSDDAIRIEKKLKLFAEMFKARPLRANNPRLIAAFIDQNNHRKEFIEWYSSIKESHFPKQTIINHE